MEPVEIKPPPQLLINRDTWHYRYFIFIRHFWGLTSTPTRTSLCPYCQTMLWFSLFAVALSPAFITGWLCLKLGRITYKIADAIGLEKMIDWVDKTPFGKWLDVSDNSMVEAPGPVALISVLVTTMAVGLPIVLVSCLISSVVYICANIGRLPGATLSFLTDIGYGLYYVFAFLGFLLHHAILGLSWLGAALAWFFTYAAFWYQVAWWVGLLAGLTAVSVAIGYIVHVIGRTRIGAAIGNYVVFRLNGYGDARKRAVARRAAAKFLEQDIPRPPKKPCFISVFFQWLKGKIVGSEREYGGDTKKKTGQMLTWFGILWEFAKGMKKNACPIIEFVEEEKKSENT